MYKIQKEMNAPEQHVLHRTCKSVYFNGRILLENSCDVLCLVLLIFCKSMERCQHPYYGQGMYFNHETQARSSVGHCLSA
jgi:hypothetical protein